MTNVLDQYPGISPVNIHRGTEPQFLQGPNAKWFVDYGRGVISPERLAALSASGMASRGMAPMGYSGGGGQGFGAGGSDDLLRKMLLERGYV